MSVVLLAVRLDFLPECDTEIERTEVNIHGQRPGFKVHFHESAAISGGSDWFDHHLTAAKPLRSSYVELGGPVRSVSQSTFRLMKRQKSKRRSNVDCSVAVYVI